ncbi:hypothetical protein Dimus_033305, partial [Dionaea muscipula]
GSKTHGISLNLRDHPTHGISGSDRSNHELLGLVVARIGAGDSRISRDSTNQQVIDLADQRKYGSRRHGSAATQGIIQLMGSAATNSRDQPRLKGSSDSWYQRQRLIKSSTHRISDITNHGRDGSAPATQGINDNTDRCSDSRIDRDSTNRRVINSSGSSATPQISDGSMDHP